MGYRELLKKYIRHLEIYAGDNYIEAPNRERLLSKRDLGELRTLAAEVTREAGMPEQRTAWKTTITACAC